MAEPACKDCRHFYPALMGNGGECMDRTKRIYNRRAAASEVEPPFIAMPEDWTCANWTAKPQIPPAKST
jgi:hypothetical protein